MKKVININFQGRVVMIEEDAYEDLKNYIESLRKHFANEKGCDEIINDIENRISELFAEIIKKGSVCIRRNWFWRIQHIAFQRLSYRRCMAKHFSNIDYYIFHLASCCWNNYLDNTLYHKI